MKDEGGRMNVDFKSQISDAKFEIVYRQFEMTRFILHPSAFILSESS